MKKRILALIMTCAMCLSLLPIGAGATLSFSGGGNGTEDTPYLLKTADDLTTLATEVKNGNPCKDKCFELGADITAADDTVIGDSSTNSFQGTFNGNNHTVTLSIYLESGTGVGLFGYLSNGGVVKNVKTTGFVSGGTNVGGICGANYGGTIDNCSNEATVTCKAQHAGGICGYNCATSTDGSLSTIKNCKNSGTVSGPKRIGGVCGYNYTNNGNDMEAIIDTCENSATVKGTSTSGDTIVGGICGYNYANGGGTCTIVNCINSGAVQGITNVGGVCGYLYSRGAHSNAILDKCINTGDVPSGNKVGGVCGYNYTSDSGTNTVTDCESSAEYQSPNLLQLIALFQSMSGLFEGSTLSVTTENTGETVCAVRNGRNGDIYGIHLSGNAISKVTYQNGDSSYAFDPHIWTYNLIQLQGEEDYIEAKCKDIDCPLKDIPIKLHLVAPENNAHTGDPVSCGFLAGEKEIWNMALWTDPPEPVYYQLDENSNEIKTDSTYGQADGPGKAPRDVGYYVAKLTVENQTVGEVSGARQTVTRYFSIAEPVPIPAADPTEFTYTGAPQTYNIPESDKYTITGATQTDAGDHTVTVSLKDWDLTQWEDGTTADKEYSFTIDDPAVIKRSTTVYRVFALDGDNGSLTVSVNQKTATLTATPDEGYTLADITAVNDNGAAVAITKNSNGTYRLSMPRSNVYVSAVFEPEDTPVEPPVEDDACPRDESCPIQPFVDTLNDFWWHDGIHYCLETGLMNGSVEKLPTGETQQCFEPNGPITRGQFVTILYRHAGTPDCEGENPFSDVKAGEYYEKAIIWASSNGIVNGYGSEEESSFGPDDSINRQQLAAILYRYAKEYLGLDVSAADSLDGFEDSGDVEKTWALPAVQWAVAEGILSGTRDGLWLMPASNATRAEAATMLYRFCENVMR